VALQALVLLTLVCLLAWNLYSWPSAHAQLHVLGNAVLRWTVAKVQTIVRAAFSFRGWGIGL